MRDIEEEIKQLAVKGGAAVAGIASRERMADCPPSGDPGYLLPSARSVISFAIPFERQVLRDYFSKKAWRPFGTNQKQILKTIYGINDLLVDYLRGQGHEALGVEVNCTYRPEKGVDDFTEMTGFVPDFSHQYGAIAAGLGRLGLSGNLLIPGYGAAFLLGTVLTSAVLDPDPVCQENPCDRCGFCTLVCPVKMMDPKRIHRAAIAGVTETIAGRRPHSCCWIGCDDYHGLSTDGTWSNWSPYRLETPVPERKKDLDALLVQLRKANPESGMEPNPYTDYRAVVFDPAWHFTAICGNCANICWKDREDREENMRLVLDSGVVVLNADGTRQATHERVVEHDTPYGVKVAMTVSESSKIKESGGRNRAFRGGLAKDQRVLDHLYRKVSSTKAV